MRPAEPSDRSNATTELYQQVILDHNRSPRNWGTVADETHRADGSNPLCGDRYTVTLKVDAVGRIEEVAVDGNGCAISKASASMMSESVKGRSVDEALQLFEQFRGLVTGETSADDASEDLGKLKVFNGIAEFPARVKCAMLSWHTLESALAGEDVASTE